MGVLVVLLTVVPGGLEYIILIEHFSLFFEELEIGHSKGPIFVGGGIFEDRFGMAF